MKKLGLALLLLCSVFSRAQSTTVSATLVDTYGITWSGATIQATFKPRADAPGPYCWNGDCNSAWRAIKITTADTGGTFSLSIPSTSAITPTGSQWEFTISPLATTQAVVIPTAVTGATLNLSASFTATVTQYKVQSTPVASAYTDGTVAVPPNMGHMYFNTTSKVFKYWDGVQWQLLSGGGGGGGGVSAVQCNNLLPLLTCIVSNPTTTPTIQMTLAQPAADTVFGNFSGTPSAPIYSVIPDCHGVDQSLNYDATIHSLTCENHPGASGTVTSIVVSAPLTGGTITNTGTIACPTCVIAPVNPAVGIAHFAGGTQTTTSSAIALGTADVSGTLPIAKGGTGTASTLVGLMRGNAAAMTAAELSGDAVTSGSNVVAVQRVNGGTIPASAVALASNSGNQVIAATTTGSGAVVLATNAVLVTPNLGTPSAINLTNATNFPSSTVANGTATMGTASIAAAPACAPVVSVAATGALTTDAIIWNANGTLKATTGYIPATTGGLSISVYPTAGFVNFDVCNWTSAAITPGVVVINWRIMR